MTTATERGDLAESLVPVAAELAFLVRDESREAIGDWLDSQGITDERSRALLVVLAAMVAAGTDPDDLLAWVTWDEEGRPLDGTAPLFPVVTSQDDDEDGHGSYRRYVQHRRAGDRKEVIEDCGCMQAARDYWNTRHAAGKARSEAARRAVAGEGQRRGDEQDAA